MSGHRQLFQTPFFLAAPCAFVLAYVCLVAANQSCSAQSDAGRSTPVIGPVAPDDSLRHLRVPRGTRVELVACEPEVVDPVAIRFDEAGRLWVVEMRDYPLGPRASDDPPRSRISVLVDEDGDGRFEKSMVFADGLLFPTGLQPWRGGVIVTLAGRVAFMKDTTGDGEADIDETWFRGFSEQNSQLRANHPCLALDNHVYVANGLRGGTIVGAKAGGRRQVELRARDFRFDPRTLACEAVSGNGQFGMTFDRWGNRFVCDNRRPLMHVVLEDRYVARGAASVGQVMNDVAAGGERSRVFSINRAWTTSNLHAGQFTAACGVLVYGGDALGEDFRGDAFVCEPTGGLVHREILTAEGASFRSRPAYEGVEFLASEDEWFRPVNLETGPDGALYVVDMYRAVIEHPEWVPEELKNRPDTRYGDDRGRIYRVTSAELVREPRKRIDLSAESNSRLIERLGDRNGWCRETAARLLLERGWSVEDRASLVRRAANVDAPVARIRALWLLSGEGSLSRATVLDALSDPHPGVRGQALTLSELHFARDDELRQRARELCGDEDASVRFLATLRLTPARDSRDIDALLKVARSSNDHWMREAVRIAAHEESSALLVSLLETADDERRRSARTDDVLGDEFDEGAAPLIRALAARVGAGDDESKQLEVLAAMARAWAQEGRAELAEAAFLGFFESSDTRISTWRSRLPDEQRRIYRRWFDRADRRALDSAVDTPTRIRAVRLLAHDDERLPRLRGFALPAADSPPVPLPLRLAAIDALAPDRSAATWNALLDAFPDSSPAIRQAILDEVLSRTERIELLLDRIERQEIRATDLDPLRTKRLLESRHERVRERAGRLLAGAVPADRREVLARYRPALELEPDEGRGFELFKQHCSACHRIGGVGTNVGPDISDSRTMTPLQLLTAVLQPSGAIDAGYVGYSVVTDDGRSYTGLLASESTGSLTLRLPEGKQVTLRRDSIEEIRSSGVSLMPDGLERELSLRDMADLIGYVKNWRYLDGRTPLGVK